MAKRSSAFLLASSLLVALPLTGCSTGGQRNFAGEVDRGNIGVALRAQVALEAGDVTTAVRLAEQAVANSSNDAGFRTLLGNAYFAAGRFRSAEAAYADALALIPSQAGVPLRLALAQAALGRGEAALATLQAHSGQIGAADTGLLMALAGRPAEAIALLDQVARAPEADARVRQNLALAHAFAGDWVQARAIAGQDLDGNQVEARMAEWAGLVRPSAPGAQVAALLGVQPAASDPGVPQRLALRRNAEPVAVAQVAPAPAPAPEPLPVAMAEAGGEVSSPTPVAVGFAEPAIASAELPAAVAEQVSDVSTAPVAIITPDVAEMVDSIRKEPVRASGALPQVAQLRRTARQRFNQSRTVVQLAAYGSEAGVRQGWSQLSRRHGKLRAFVPASARFNGPNGTVWRLSLKGFSSDLQARRVCMELRASGASCFVRAQAGDSPVRFASR